MAFQISSPDSADLPTWSGRTEQEASAFADKLESLNLPSRETAGQLGVDTAAAVAAFRRTLKETPFDVA